MKKPKNEITLSDYRPVSNFVVDSYFAGSSMVYSIKRVETPRKISIEDEVTIKIEAQGFSGKFCNEIASIIAMALNKEIRNNVKSTFSRN